MKNKKTIFNYILQVFAIFGFSMIFMVVFTALAGDEAQRVSTMFALGSKGVPLDTMFQYLAMAVIVTFLRYVFFTDKLIKNASITTRTLGMLVTVLIATVLFIVSFGWFPVNMLMPWVMFFACFTISTALSIAICFVKEKSENIMLTNALEKKKGEMKK